MASANNVLKIISIYRGFTANYSIYMIYKCFEFTH